MGCIALVRCVLVLRCGLAVVVWYLYAGEACLFVQVSRLHTHTHTPTHTHTHTHTYTHPHTHIHTTDRTIHSKCSVRHTGHYLHNTIHIKQNRPTSIPSVEFEPVIPAIKRLQTGALDRMANGLGLRFV